MPKKHRLTGAQIRRLTSVKRLTSSLFSLSSAAATGPDTQVACVVSKKVSAKAAVRNLIKRRMRAALRALSPLPAGLSLVLIAKKQTTDTPYAGVRDDIAQLMLRLRSGK